MRFIAARFTAAAQTVMARVMTVEKRRQRSTAVINHNTTVCDGATARLERLAANERFMTALVQLSQPRSAAVGREEPDDRGSKIAGNWTLNRSPGSPADLTGDVYNFGDRQ